MFLNFASVVTLYSSLFPMQHRRHQKDTISKLDICVGPIVTSRKWSYCKGKKEIVTCGKFKITERQNESCQNLQSWKVPKLWQIFGKIGLGVRVPKLWRIPRVRQIQEIHIKYTWKTYRGTLDQGEIEPSTDLDRPYCNYLVGYWLGRREFPPKIDLFFGKSKGFLTK